MVRLFLFVFSAIFLLAILRKKEISRNLLYFAVVSPILLQFAAAVYYVIQGGWSVNGSMASVTFLPVIAGMISIAVGAFPTWYKDSREADRRFDEMLKKEEEKRITTGGNDGFSDIQSALMNYENQQSPGLERLVKPLIAAAVTAALGWLILVRIIDSTHASSLSSGEYYYYPLIILFCTAPLITKVFVPEIKKSLIVFASGVAVVVIATVLTRNMNLYKENLHLDYNPGVYILFLILFLIVWCISLYVYNSDGFSSSLKTTTFRNTYREGRLINSEMIGESIRSLDSFGISPAYMSFFFWAGVWMAADSILRLIIFTVMYVVI